MNQLDILAQYRDAILLYEAIGWLHDYRKCSDEQLRVQAANLVKQHGLPNNELVKRFSMLTVGLPVLPILRYHSSCTIADLLNKKRQKDLDVLYKYLNRCHRTAHFDKQEPVGGEQNYPGVQISTPFGFERDVPSNLTCQLWKLPWNMLASYSATNRIRLREAINSLFVQTVADTRRPINEVDLWGWGLLVGALYKSALAGVLLTGNTPIADNLRWRLLGIRINGLDYIFNVLRIPDLLARQELLSDSLDKIRNLIEVTYPLGSEVYRDENGSVFVVPDILDLLKRTDINGNSLRALILQEFKQGTLKGNPDLQLGGEIEPCIELEQIPWWGQDPNWSQSLKSSNDKLPDIATIISANIIGQTNADEIKRLWQTGTVTDICTVCGLRPQGSSRKDAERNVCDICEKRRAGRAKEWVTSQQDKTIWTDEVADDNGRLALITGQFDLTHWLDGSLLNSFLVIVSKDEKNNKINAVNKTPSFSRVWRIWETTRLFWQQVESMLLQQTTDDRRRLKIYLNSDPNLAPYHIYDLHLGATEINVVWVPPQSSCDGYLITVDNLGYIARQLGAESAVYTDSATAAIYVEDYLRHCFVKNTSLAIFDNTDTLAGQRGKKLIEGKSVAELKYQTNQYATAIPILAEPRTFMALVPADKAMDLVRYIKMKYENEMGKVLNRLPLHLGLVFANRRTPLRAVLDAGRHMLNQKAPGGGKTWRVKSVRKEELPTENTRFGKQFNSAVVLELEQNNRLLTWYVPLKMGDGTTFDDWYPYVFWEKDAKGETNSSNAGRKYAFRSVHPAIGSCCLVHANELQEGDQVYFDAATFDFEYLDTAGRRFEIYYDDNGRRSRGTRPFYLENLDRLDVIWNLFKRLAVAQRYQVVSTIEAARERWYGQDIAGRSWCDPVFRQFVADTLAAAAWPKDCRWNDFKNEQENLIQAGVSGELADVAELYMEVLKE